MTPIVLSKGVHKKCNRQEIAYLEKHIREMVDEMEEFTFYLNDDGKTILGIYDLSGNDQDLATVKDAVEYCRANEKQ